MNATDLRARCSIAAAAPVTDVQIAAYYNAGKRHGAASLPALPSFLSRRSREARDVLSRAYYTGHADGTAARFTFAR